MTFTNPRPLRRLTLAQVDVFTQVPFEGNPLAVVLEADDLSADIMRAIAREMNLSETAFVSAARGSEVPVRFFTPRREVPVCGHGTLGAQFVRARALGLDHGSVRQRSPGGVWTVRWEAREEGTFLTMVQGPVHLGRRWGGSQRDELLGALGLDGRDLVSGWPIDTVSTGHAKVMVPVASSDVLTQLDPDMDALDTLSGRTGVGGYFVFSADERSSRTKARMFGPALGIPEDPVNGSGHGPLGAYLRERGGVFADWVEHGFWSSMGDHLGRPGKVWVRGASETEVEVGGFVTPVFETEIPLPEPAESRAGRTPAGDGEKRR